MGRHGVSNHTSAATLRPASSVDRVLQPDRPMLVRVVVRFLRSAAVLSAVLAVVPPAGAAPRPAPLAVRSARVPTDSTDAALARQIDAILRPLADSGRFSGVVLVAQGGRVRFERAYGLASVELGVPNTPATRFRLHSITKQFTAAAVLQLVARRRVALDAPVHAYLPELPSAWRGVTVHQLLTHTSGIPDVEDVWADSLITRGGARLLENLARVAPALAGVAPSAAPGATWRYNNFGYDLLACVVERASGRPFAEYLAAEVFGPAGMTDAGVDARAEGGGYVASAVVPRLASGYNGGPVQLQGAAPRSFAQPGAGSVYATARDLWRYDQALTRGLVVPAAEQRVGVERAFRLSARGAYGYGWIVTRAAADTAAYFLHHSGGNNGYVSEYARYPREGAAIVVLANRNVAEPEALRGAISALLFGDRYPMPRRP